MVEREHDTNTILFLMVERIMMQIRIFARFGKTIVVVDKFKRSSHQRSLRKAYRINADI